ncbi:hypothetical protein OF83DRAFT_1167349 [Amylostereum chailletii]|nr:hypothetical protein OF83DRAFT_1167349 [Amylostereum chailletii]
MTDPDPSRLKIKKRIVVCCDGTWQDGITVKERWQYTNILRLSRAINHVDERFMPPKPQIVFYQSGVGTENSVYSALLDGATGASLGDKVQEAYAFIAHNYEPGDEIFLFGFSRGAYTARMVATMIEKIGVLDRTEMDHFASIFINFQKRGKEKNPSEIEKLDKKLAPWTQHNSPGKIRADFDGDTFSIKCIGVFDTVGSLGLPEELTMIPGKIKTLFGFPDSVLGPHIENAYQALALNETRADFTCNKYFQTEEGRQKKQVLKQCWFAGCHSDIGGGYEVHDLADVTMTWMAAQIGDILSLDVKYLFSLMKPNAPWGAQEPHDPATGIFVLADKIKRPLPTEYSLITHEMIHSSVQCQDTVSQHVKDLLARHPELVAPLLPLEEEAKVNWHYPPGPSAGIDSPNDHGNKTAKAALGRRWPSLGRAKEVFARKAPQTVDISASTPKPSTSLDVTRDLKVLTASSSQSSPARRSPKSPALRRAFNFSTSKKPKAPIVTEEPGSPTIKSPNSPIIVTLKKNSSKHGRRSSWFSRKPSEGSNRTTSSNFSAFVRELVD